MNLKVCSGCLLIGHHLFDEFQTPFGAFFVKVEIGAGWFVSHVNCASPNLFWCARPANQAVSETFDVCFGSITGYS